MRGVPYQNSTLFRQVVGQYERRVQVWHLCADGSSFDMKKIIDRKDKIVKKLTGGVKMTVNSYGAVIVPQEAVIVGEADGRFQLSAAGEAYEVTYLLVCTGSDTLNPSH